MKLIHFPYRWTRRTWWKNITYGWDCIQSGFENLYKWFPIIWEDRWFDFSFALEILEFKLRYMADRFEERGWSMGSKEDAREMRIAAELCKRINEEEIYFQDGYFKSNKMKDIQFRHRQEDMKYLGKLLGRKGLSWWD